VLLTITRTESSIENSTAAPATDLGFLLHKNPDKVHSFAVSSGQAHVFYPVASAARCTMALLLEVDPVALVRGRRPGGPAAFSLTQYVNDRPYAASSLLAVALSRVFRTAMTGRCDARPELAAAPIPLEIHVPALPCRGGAEVATRLFEPLGWSVEARPVPLDPQLPGWGDSRFLDVRLRGEVRLAEALNHLYVLLPVLDDAKHYWVTTAEVDKLVRAGEGWLETQRRFAVNPLVAPVAADEQRKGLGRERHGGMRRAALLRSPWPPVKVRTYRRLGCQISLPSDTSPTCTEPAQTGTCQRG